MLAQRKLLAKTSLLVAACSVSFALLLALLPLRGAPPDQNKTSDPWTPSQIVQPMDFARELSDPANTHPPTVVYVGFGTLYAGAHIPGAVYPGQASSPEGLAALKKWAEKTPRNANVVIYCGCCPFDHCPNIRPAFAALRDMGFTQLRVLALPRDFASDWIAKGYPVQKGK